ncbi:MAG: UDP-N-acetyl-D-mannosamine dehydrogenase, partial [Anaerolineae bacterium]
TAPDLAQLIWTARQVNDAQPQFVVQKVRQALGDLAGKRIAALGLAYKADVDDLRESPALEVVHLLQQEGAQVVAFEPYKPDNGLPGIHSAPTLNEALQQAEAVLFLVGHAQFRALTPEQLASLTPARILIDTVNILSGPAWLAAGFQLRRLGAGEAFH